MSKIVVWNYATAVFFVAFALLAFTTNTRCEAKKQVRNTRPEDNRDRHWHDPDFYVGRWGQYGRVPYGPDWLHKEFSKYTRQNQDPHRDDPVAKYEQQQYQQRLEDQHAKSAKHTKTKEPPVSPLPSPPRAWAKLSALTASAVPPLVVHIPMTEDEQTQHARILEQESVARTSGSGASMRRDSSVPKPEDLPWRGHRLPQTYQDRVRSLASDQGFQYIGLAVPTVMPEHHVFHVHPELFRSRMQAANKTAAEQGRPHHQNEAFLPPREPYDRWWPSPDSDTQLHSQDWHRQARESTYRLSPEDPDVPDEGVTTIHSLRAWQNRFAAAMRERNRQKADVAAWQQRWKEWAAGINHTANTVFMQHRDGVLETLRRGLMEQTNGQVKSVEPQHSKPRVLRWFLGRQPTMWHSYRERWDADSGDQRPARSLRDDSGHGSIADPMLTDQWNLYDAMAWGDLPPGPHVYRPSMTAGPMIWDLLGYTGRDIVIGMVDSGFELGHPELTHRYARATSIDALSHGGNRPPVPLDPWAETHGTQVAGVALAERNNGFCGAGVAPDAKLGAIRLLGHRSPTDAEEAAALSHACRPHGSHPSRNALINHMYSCSWGPMDDGADLRGPGPLAVQALEACVYREGRQGKGSIYIWAGGNGRAQEDNVNFDGYANRPETIAVGAIDDTTRQAWYSEPGACLLVSAPSSGGASGIVSSDPSGPAGLSINQCTRNFGGTSAAAPSVAGVVALMLEAAPDLGWRDVQHILVESADQVQANDHREPWTLNAAGYWHSHGYGFGLINATQAVLLASNWVPLRPRQASIYTSPILGANPTWDQHTRHHDADRDASSVNATKSAKAAKRGSKGVRFEPDPLPDKDATLEEKKRARKPIDTTGYDPDRPGNHGWIPRVDPQVLLQHGKEKEALAGEAKQEEQTERPKESVLKSMLFFGTRFLAHQARKFARNVEAMAQERRERRLEATRELAPNHVRSLGNGNGVAIPPGFSAYFEWEYPDQQTRGDSNADKHSWLDHLEHVGLRIDASLPTGRGHLRIWLCAPSGTCSLMAQAPRNVDRHDGIDGNRWTFWTVRHWNEPPVADVDLTGHGSRTWSLRVTHTWPIDLHRAHRLRDFRVRHPDKVDAVIRWWQLEFRGRMDT